MRMDHPLISQEYFYADAFAVVLGNSIATKTFLFSWHIRMTTSACIHPRIYSVTRDPYRSTTRIIPKCDTYQKNYMIIWWKTSHPSPNIRYKTDDSLVPTIFVHSLLRFGCFSFVVYLFYSFIFDGPFFRHYLALDAIMPMEKGEEMIASVTQHQNATDVWVVSRAFWAGKYEVKSLVASFGTIRWQSFRR